jgi:hypothetical protein
VAAQGASTEPARVRRRVAEVAADRGASAGSGRDRRPAPAGGTEPETPRSPRRGLLKALRAAADVIVGRREEDPPPPPEPVVPERKRTRRGHRGGRGRGSGGGSGGSAPA